jgi:hypothetical protein
MCGWEDNIKMLLKEIWWEGVHLIHLAQDMYVCMYKGWAIKPALAPRPLMIYLAQDKDQWPALVNSVMDLFGSTKYWEYLKWLSNYQRLKEDSVPWSYLRLFGVSRAKLNP